MTKPVFLGTETTKTKREQPKQRREWQYNAEKHKGKASASRVSRIWFDHFFAYFRNFFMCEEATN